MNPGSMSQRERMMSSGSSFAGRAAGHEQAFFKALHKKVYAGKQGSASPRGEQIMIDDGRRSKCVGVLYPGGVFVKQMEPEHVLRVPPAIAIQKDAVENLDRKDCKTIRAEITDGRRLVVSFAKFRQECFPVDRGFGPQIALLLSKWENANALQGDLFGGAL